HQYELRIGQFTTTALINAIIIKWYDLSKESGGATVAVFDFSSPFFVPIWLDRIAASDWI
ncbi:Hypothetical protein FKW44_008306, partial [Caligus rogercresseyi]